MIRPVIAAALVAAAAVAGLWVWWQYGEPQPWVLMRNTVVLSLGTSLIALPLGTGLAILTARTDLPGSRVIWLSLLVLLFVPLYLTAAAWDAGFGQLGWHTLMRSGSREPWLAGWRASIWIHAMAATPWVMLLVAAAARHIQSSLEEEALLDGTSLQVLWHVTLRRLRPALAVAGLWVLLATAAEMTVTDLYRVRTYAEVLYTGFALGDELPDSLVRVLPGMVAAGALVVIGYLVAASLAPSYRTSARSPWVFRLGGWRWPLLAFSCVVLILIVAVPLGNLLYKAGVRVQWVDGRPQRTWALGSLWETVATVPGRYGEEFGWTFVLGAATATAAVAIGLPLAWLARRSRRWAELAVAISAVGLALPGPLIGLGIIWLLDRPFPPGWIWLYDRTLFAPILAMLVRTLPIAILFGWHILQSVADDVLDAAACDGAGRWRQFWWIAAPPRLGSLLAVWLVVFALAAGDLACSILVVPPGVTTVPIRVFGLLHAGVDDQVAAVSLVMLAGLLPVPVLVMSLLRIGPRGQNTSRTK
jgi:iron(III) transport system permease protein